MPPLAGLVLLLTTTILATTVTGSALAQTKGGNKGTLEQPAGLEREGIDGVTARLLGSPPQQLMDLEGKPVRAISVESSGTRWPAKATIRSVTLGERLSTQLCRRALRELLDTGDYAQAYADARPFQDGVVLRLVVVPRRRIATIHVEGGSLSRERTLEAAGLEEEGEITEPLMGEASQGVRDLYGRYGYDDAQVRIATSDTDDPRRVLVTLDITPGKQRSISQRIFVVEPRFDRVLGDLKREYAVESGDSIDEDELIDANNEMAATLREAGFLEAMVKHRVLRRGPDAFLYVYLQTGPQYRFFFEGNFRFDDSELTDALELEEGGADTSTQALTARVRDFYRSRGLYDVRVATEARDVRDGGVRELHFRVVEGRLVRVTQRLLPCLPARPVEGLSAEDIEKEIDAVLLEELPSMPLLHSIDDVTIDDHFSPGGSRAVARRLEPEATYLPESYDRVVKHLEKLLNSKGYLNAVVGPVGVIRAECDPSARGGQCEPFEPPPLPPSLCRRDALELPIPESRLAEEHTCQPDPLRSIHCAPTMTLHLPIQLGPQTQLYDLVFEGNETVDSHTLVELAEFQLGAPFSNIELDAARQRIINAYRDRGYAYVTVSTEVNYSPDRTRARARVIVNEHEPVIISGYEIRGASRTKESVIIRRLALCQDLASCADEDKYYRRNLVRESEEQIATLGTFSSVSIGLEDPDIPQKHKRVIITVVEQPSQYLEPRIGFSTGEGLRVALEYGHRNIAGRAIGLTLRVEFTTLPDFLILDEDVRETYQEFTVSERLERRNSASLRFPDVGLGPRVDVVVDGIDVRDNQRDFGLTREALIPTLGWRPIRQVTNQLGLSVELNDVTLFHADDMEGAIADNNSLANLLRVPEGRTIAFAERLATSWDRRDNSLAATTGTLLTTSVEHVTAMPLEPLDDEAEAARQAALPDGCQASEDLTSEFLRLTSRMAGYIRLTDEGVALAISVGAGYNVQLTCWSDTYPDRLFYLGGVNTVRGFQLDEMVPEDVAQKILKGELDITDVGIRGGNLYINPRAELRVPLTDVFGIGLFLDTGNVWTSTDSLESVLDLMALRYAAGGGLRIATPIGPVALDYGFKLVRRDWEDLGALHFSIGLF